MQIKRLGIMCNYNGLSDAGSRFTKICQHLLPDPPKTSVSSFTHCTLSCWTSSELSHPEQNCFVRIRFGMCTVAIWEYRVFCVIQNHRIRTVLRRWVERRSSMVAYNRDVLSLCSLYTSRNIFGHIRVNCHLRRVRRTIRIFACALKRPSCFCVSSCGYRNTYGS